MSRLSLLVVVSFSMAALAGCVENPLPGPSADDSGETLVDKAIIYERVKALLEGVPCEASVDATKTSDNLKLLANTTFMLPGKETDELQAVGSRELDVRGDLMLTTLANRGSVGIFDARDPLMPTPLSVVDVKGEYDVKFATNDTAVAGVSAGIAIIDIRNPMNITQTGLWKWEEAPQPPRGLPLQNAHMLATARIAEKDWVFLAPNSNTGAWVLELTGEPGAKKLEFVAQTLPVEGGPLGPHDMTVQYDADLKTWILYSADGFHGWAAFNVNNPAKPELMGGLSRPETGYTHTIQAAKVGNRRLVATIQEVGVNQLEIYDATNLRAPVLLGRWQHEAGSVNPQHNLNIVAGRLYVAHYGNGVYVFDLNKLGMLPLVSDVKPVAHYGAAASQNPLGFQQFYDVVVKEGVVYAASYSKPTLGIHVIGDGCLAPGDASQTSMG